MAKKIENGIEVDGCKRTVHFDGYAHDSNVVYRNALSVEIDKGELRLYATHPDPHGNGERSSAIYRSLLTMEQCSALSRMFADAAREALAVQLKPKDY